MASPELSARLKYLNESAHLLATTAPTVSKHLLSSYNSLLFDNNLDPADPQRQETCGACGTIVILGLETTMEPQRRRRVKGKRDAQGPTSKSFAYVCNCCNRKTRYPYTTSLPRHNPKLVYLPQPPSTVTLSAGLPSSSKSTPPETSNPSSKKRAKSRKQGGLQALLAKQKASQGASSGFGLDLLDFMKK